MNVKQGFTVNFASTLSNFFEDKEIKVALDEWGLSAVYEEYLQQKNATDKIGREIKKLEKTKSRLEMYENHIDLLKEYEIEKNKTHGLKKKVERLLLGE